MASTIARSVTFRRLSICPLRTAAVHARALFLHCAMGDRPLFLDHYDNKTWSVPCCPLLPGQFRGHPSQHHQRALEALVPWQRAGEADVVAVRLLRREQRPPGRSGFSGRARGDAVRGRLPASAARPAARSLPSVASPGCRPESSARPRASCALSPVRIARAPCAGNGRGRHARETRR